MLTLMRFWSYRLQRYFQFINSKIPSSYYKITHSTTTKESLISLLEFSKIKKVIKILCVCVHAHSVVSDSLWPHGMQLAKLLCQLQRFWRLVQERRPESSCRGHGSGLGSCGLCGLVHSGAGQARVCSASIAPTAGPGMQLLQSWDLTSVYLHW